MGYQVNIDLENTNNSHTQIIKKIPKYANVLELGCAHGDMSRILKRELQCRIIGIEQDPVAAADADQVCDYAFVEDLNKPDSLDALVYEKFDVISLADVLEHLDDPLAVLKRLKPLLLPEDGRLLLSVPNVAHASVRLELLTGSFDYQDTGILDRTHKHFYTVDSIQTLLHEAGYQLHELDYTWHELPDTVIEEYLNKAGLKLTSEALDFFHSNECVAYQFIISASPIDASISHSTKNYELKPLEAGNHQWKIVNQRLHQAEQELEQIKKSETWQKMMGTVS